MPETIHIVAPTLTDQTGHCFSHLGSLRAAASQLGTPLEAWVGRRADGLFPPDPCCLVQPCFQRPWHRLQTFWLYRRLLRQPGRIYVPTATRTDVLLLSWAAPGVIPDGKVFLLFHWLRLSPAKARMLARLAARQPNLVILAPSEGIARSLRSCGFARPHVVPYPITPRESVEPAPRTPDTPRFRQVLFAGAARADKGFAHVVALVEHLARLGDTTPVVVQVSPPHTGKLEPAVCSALAELEHCRYPRLDLRTETLTPKAYADLFAGAVCLQPYDHGEYAGDRLSGVTLDALSAGCPLIATADTWMARTIARFGAGVAVQDLSPASLWAAISEVRGNYASYAASAGRGGRILQEENSGTRLLEFITTYAPAT